MTSFNRRAFILTGIVALGTSLASTPSRAEETLVVVGQGGSYQEAQRKAFFEPFTKETGIRIIEQSPSDPAKFQAMVESGNVEWDVVDVDQEFVYRGSKLNLFEKIDYATAGVKAEDFDAGLISDYSVPSIVWSTTLNYNSERIDAEKSASSWAEFWDVEKFPGDRTLNKRAINTLEIALLADGVEADKLYPLDVDRAFKSLDKIKPHVQVWWETAGKAEQLLVDGEVTYSAAGNARVQKAKRDGAPVDVNWGQALQTSQSWVIPRGTPHRDAAVKFIAFVSQPERQADLAKLIDYGPSNKRAFEFIDDDAQLPTSPRLQEQAVKTDPQWWSENYEKVSERFNQWLLK
ncbi:putative spermidine/putrescine transport system substrate-binding protein [Ochrobactrum sp. RC6B]|uniref:Spermidine/putrescine transport system substrate-binding protein n=2 Tax=Brucella intermedia TaxID=94625 RepID=A0ABR6AU31_9HYPH|nr:MULTISPECIES: ABC transporter substrate-binding protein [Brucella/Ochrobactrum group]MBA8852799.1 putative spermidine/putrescine transport system substrate-binding protein [Brucella intermedia]MBB3217286.1 putative spermidine/putrescine transport system substrate-binding protein [Ochrobactrum sp. RC6B]MDH0125946.1 polyamine ABC transporter substrate-binding protein [Brucella intermedia GD04153]NYD80431.1 putative spermidine/putrescine transport system substrate-binding protein [Brucella inte